MAKKLSRRDFLKRGIAASGIVAAGAALASINQQASSLDPTLTPAAYLPLVMYIPSGPPVVRVSSNSATISGSGNYYTRVDQSVVNTMVDQGVMKLTGKSSVADAWRALVPNYQAGKIIAVKMNFNNTINCTNTDNNIDALAQPVIAMVRGLVQIGVRQQDICVYDAIRSIPNYFSGAFAATYPGVKFYDNYNGATCHNLATFSTSAAGEVVYQKPALAKDHLPDLLLNASYLINVPIMKYHPLAGMTLGMKNHLGSIKNPAALHPYIDKVRGGSTYSSSYNPLVDLNKHSAIRSKTVLILGDALFGNWVNNTDAPQPWNIFGGKYPNSLFFSTDPVAADCVMADYVRFERDPRFASNNDKVLDWCYDYLRLAKTAGLGVFEKRSTINSSYTAIHYSEYEV